MTPWSLPTVACLFSCGQEGLLPWASSGDNHPQAARNLWGREDTTWKPLSLRAPYGSLRSQNSLFKWPLSPVPGSLQAHPWISSTGDTPCFRCARSQVQGWPFGQSFDVQAEVSTCMWGRPMVLVGASGRRRKGGARALRQGPQPPPPHHTAMLWPATPRGVRF